MAPSKAAKKIINSIKPKSFRGVSNSATPLGEIGYDNPRDDIESFKNLREGTITDSNNQKILQWDFQ